MAKFRDLLIDFSKKAKQIVGRNFGTSEVFNAIPDTHQVERKTWDSEISRDVPERLVHVYPPAERLAAVRFGPGDEISSLAAAYRGAVLAPLDLEIVRQLQAQGFLWTLLEVDGISVSWMFSDEGRSKDLNENVNGWLLRCVEGRRDLFVFTYSIWTRLVKTQRQLRTTESIAGSLAYAAVTFGYYAEAAEITEYMIARCEADDPDPDRDDSYVNWLITQGVAQACLGEEAAAMGAFKAAITFAEDRLQDHAEDEVHNSTYEALLDRAKFYTMRERLRHLARTRLRTVDARWPAVGSPEERALLHDYQKALAPRDMDKLWPIDLDTAARCTLLLEGAANPEALKEACRYLEGAKKRFRKIQRERTARKDKRHHARYANDFELDCLRTTEILVRLAEGRVDEARNVLTEYGSVDLKTRRHSQRVARRLRLMVETAEAARKSVAAPPAP